VADPDGKPPDGKPPDGKPPESERLADADTSGVPIAVTAMESAPSRARRLSAAMQATVSGGVEAIGAGIGTIGEGVTKLGDVTKNVPLVGAGVAKLGESLTRAGDSIGELPRVARTRRGRLLVRSVLVGLFIVTSWIAVIVAVQVRANDTPDFRPLAEHILVDISKGSGAIDKVYEASSPRFQEMVRKERFIDEMTDMNTTLGKFREIDSINSTLVTTGPTGHVGRVSVTAAFERGVSKGSISFHLSGGDWKLLGIGFEVPPELKISQAQRAQRVAACVDDKGHDLSEDRKKCPVRDAAESILEALRDGRAADVWNAASPVFQKQESRDTFLRIEQEQQASLGSYKRILKITEAKAIGGTSATFDVLAEFEKSSGVRAVFAFERDAKSSPWRLRSLKIVVPMPRAEDSAEADASSGGG
jgi:hypothetical protein